MQPFSAFVPACSCPSCKAGNWCAQTRADWVRSLPPPRQSDLGALNKVLPQDGGPLSGQAL